MGYALVVTEKPSVAQSIAAVLGAAKRGDGYLEGGGWLVSWCYGHLVELASAEAYGEQYKKWSHDDLPIALYEGDRSSGERRQQLDIFLNFVGQFKAPNSVPATTPEEQAAAEAKLAKKLERRTYHKQWRDKKKAAREAAKSEAEVIVIDADDSIPKPAA